MFNRVCFGLMVSLSVLSPLAKADGISPGAGPLIGVDHIGGLEEGVINQFRLLNMRVVEFRRALVQEVGRYEPILQFTNELNQDVELIIRTVRNRSVSKLELLRLQINAQNTKGRLFLAIKENQLSSYPGLRDEIAAIHQASSMSFPLFTRLRQETPSDGSMKDVYYCKAITYTSDGTLFRFHSAAPSHYQAYQEALSTCNRAQSICSLEECRLGGQIIP